MKKYKLKDICNKITDGSHNPPKGVNSSEYLMLSSKNVNNDLITYEQPRYLTKEEFEIENKRTDIQRGDVLLTIVGTIGRCAVYDKDENVVLQRSVAVIKPKEDLIDSRFLMYRLINLSNVFSREARGGAQKGIYLKQLANIEFYVPHLDVQKKIVEILDAAKCIMDKRKKQIEELDLLVKSRFIEMFGVPLSNTKGWNEQLAGEVCFKITDGSHFSPKDCPDSNIPMLSVKDMMADRFSYDTCKHVSEEDYEELKKNGCKPMVDDVLIAKDGSYFYYGFVLEKEIEQALLSSIAILRPNKEMVTPHYLRYYMMSQEVVDLVGKKYVSGAALKRVILKGIRQIPVMVPPIELQNQFADFVKQVDKLKFEMEISLKELENNFNSLMQKAFKGDIFNDSRLN